jgi:hypothetical protein
VARKISDRKLLGRLLLPIADPPRVLNWVSRPTHDVALEPYISPYVESRVVSVYYQERDITYELLEYIEARVHVPGDHPPVHVTLASNDRDVIVLHPTVTPEMLGRMLSVALYDGDGNGFQMVML